MAAPELTWKDWLQQHDPAGLFELPDELADSPWQPTDKDREAAWVIYTQLRTRISTQALHYRSGDEETALDSLYKLFGIVRDTIGDKGPECRHLATIAIPILNTHIRPLTARWHKKKVEGRLQNDDDRREFRRELTTVQRKVVAFCGLLGAIAEADAERDPNACESTARKRKAELGAAIPFDEMLFDSKDDIEHQELKEQQQLLYDAERKEIVARRNALDQPVNTRSKADQPDTPDNLVGLACSGGGIRSATFCLGVVQSLAQRKGILPRLDYVSTVSGGGYFGSFLSSYLNDGKHQDRNIGLDAGQLPFSEAGKPEPAPMRSLRNSSKFLIKGGLLGQARMAGLLLYGMLVNLLTLIPVLLVAVAAAKYVQWADWNGAMFHGGFDVPMLLKGLLAILAFMVLLLPWIHRKNKKKPERIVRYERRVIIVGVALVILWAVGWLMPRVYAVAVSQLGSPNRALAAFALLPLLLAVGAFMIGTGRMLGRMLIALVGITGPLLILIAGFVLDARIPAGGNQILYLLLGAALVTFWLMKININQISPHRFYRNRLAETYLLRHDQEPTMDVPVFRPLTELREDNPAAPYHLINTAVNLPASKNPELRGRNSDFLLFSQCYSGSPLLGYCPTEDLLKKDPHLDLGTAMAISGAAASSHMGTLTVGSLTFWLAFLNIRLAYWLPNPKRLDDVKDGSPGRPFALWREMFGLMDEHGKFVNVSDGGHIENLGIYELLRRRCKFIISIDGEADPDMSFPGLMQLIRFARIDFGIRIEIDLGDLAKNADGYSKAHFVLGRIHYPDGSEGHLLYIKSSVTGNERDYVLDYRRANPTFPHESTADQFFSEAQFEAYRELGNHIGDDLMQPELLGGIQDPTLEQWFTEMVRNLSEDAIDPGDGGPVAAANDPAR